MIEAIVLAAGKATRFGKLKPLLEVGGRSALSVVINTLLEADIDQIVIVLGYKEQTIRESVDLSCCRVVVNPDYNRGMSTSLRLGIESLSGGVEGFLVVLADMPYVSSETVRRVIAKARNDAQIVAPVYRGQRGFPVFFSSECTGGLLASLRGDVGARHYMANHEDKIRTIPVADPGALYDIDHPSDHIEEER